MTDDPLALIAASYRGIAESTQRLAALQRGLVWLQGFALVMIGLALCALGYLVWHAEHQRQDHAVLTQALLTQSQTLSIQTQALSDVLQRLPASH